MNYLELKDFIARRMRMSHIYQPVMLMALLKNGGVCSTTKIAKAILKYDEAQIEYYEQITNNMVGKVLLRHGIVEKSGKNYSLILSRELTHGQVDELVGLCQQRLDEYIGKRGEKIFLHRKLSSGYEKKHSKKPQCLRSLASSYLRCVSKCVSSVALQR